MAWEESSREDCQGYLDRYGVTQREIIERLANQADRAVVDRLELDSAEWNTYFSVTP